MAQGITDIIMVSHCEDYFSPTRHNDKHCYILSALPIPCWDISGSSGGIWTLGLPLSSAKGFFIGKGLKKGGQAHRPGEKGNEKGEE